MFWALPVFYNFPGLGLWLFAGGEIDTKAYSGELELNLVWALHKTTVWSQSKTQTIQIQSNFITYNNKPFFRFRILAPAPLAIFVTEFWLK